jgi:hypothetical protein
MKIDALLSVISTTDGQINVGEPNPWSITGNPDKAESDPSSTERQVDPSSSLPLTGNHDEPHPSCLSTGKRLVNRYSMTKMKTSWSESPVDDDGSCSGGEVEFFHEAGEPDEPILHGLSTGISQRLGQQPR